MSNIVLVIDLGNALYEYKRKILSVLQEPITTMYDTYSGSNNLLSNTILNVNHYTKESIAQIMDIVSIGPLYFFNHVINGPKLALIYGSITSQFTPHIKILLSDLWRELASEVYLQLSYQFPKCLDIEKFILINVLPDAIIIAQDALYGL